MLNQKDISPRHLSSSISPRSALLKLISQKTNVVSFLLSEKLEIQEISGPTKVFLNTDSTVLEGTHFLEIFSSDAKVKARLTEVFRAQNAENIRFNFDSKQFDLTLELHQRDADHKCWLGVLACARENENRFREVTNAAPFFIWIFDEHGQCEHLNRTWANFRGRPNLEGSNESWRDAMSPKDAFLFESQILHSIKNSRPLECELRMERADGQFRWVLWRGMPRTSESGQIFGYMATGIDITPQKEVQLHLEKSTRDLERSNQELEQFAYVASHDLQEPLRMISSFIELLREEYSQKFDDTAEEYMSFIQDACLRMRSLIQDLLAYSRIGRSTSITSLISSEDTMLNALKILRPLIDSSSSKIEFSNLPVVMANFNQLSQVFQNLIENAIKYRSVDDPRIIITCQAKGSVWEFIVQDNGIGFDMRFHDRIFQLFQRLHAREKYPGSGIGLAITKKIIESLGGNIWAKSEPQRGARFYFTLPRKPGRNL